MSTRSEAEARSSETRDDPSAPVPATRQLAPVSVAVSVTAPGREARSAPTMISMNSGTPSSASPGCNGADAPVTPSASQRCTDTSWAWCRPTAPAVCGSGHQAQHGASGPTSRRAPTSEYVHQPSQASRSPSTGTGVISAPDRSLAFCARTF